MEHLEGRISVLAALEARRRRIEIVLVGANAHAGKADEVVEAARRAGVPVKRVPSSELDRMAHGRTHGGVAAVCAPRPATPLPELLQALEASDRPPLLLLLEGVEDARNLGFTLRSAEALGAHGVLIKKHVWDFDGADVSRASSGAYERLPLVRLEDARPAVGALREKGVALWGCLANAKRSLYQVDLSGPVALAIGGEKRGLSRAVRDMCGGFLSIPMTSDATSLPLGHAAAILMAEAARQRGKGHERGDLA